MDDTTSDTLDQTDEEILTYTVSDEALEAAGSGSFVLPSVGRYCTIIAALCLPHPEP
jgi:hypothetical protein